MPEIVDVVSPQYAKEHDKRAVRVTAAGLDHHSLGFVDNKQIVVLINNIEINRLGLWIEATGSECLSAPNPRSNTVVLCARFPRHKSVHVQPVLNLSTRYP